MLPSVGCDRDSVVRSMDVRKDQSGFTLVELMVVVLIIGILVAIAIPVFANVKDKARLRTCQGNQRTIEGAAQQYYATNGTLWTQTRRFNGNNTANTVDVLKPAYIKIAPKCPRSGLYYYVDGTGTVIGDRDAAGWTSGHSHY